jgi:transcriptional regulator with XRE-family HTH domain
MTRQRKSLVVSFGERVRAVRTERGLSLRELAELLPSSDSAYLCRLELGRGRSGPTLATVEELADALEVSPRDLVP